MTSRDRWPSTDAGSTVETCTWHVDSATRDSSLWHAAYWLGGLGHFAQTPGVATRTGVAFGPGCSLPDDATWVFPPYVRILPGSQLGWTLDDWVARGASEIAKYEFFGSARTYGVPWYQGSTLGHWTTSGSDTSHFTDVECYVAGPWGDILCSGSSRWSRWTFTSSITTFELGDPGASFVVE